MGKKPPLSPPPAVFHKVAQNLYRLDSSEIYYALFKRAGKQIRRSLKTTNPALARRRLGELVKKVARLNQVKGAGKILFCSLTWPNVGWITTASISRKNLSAGWTPA
jgi:hypothetical protein